MWVCPPPPPSAHALPTPPLTPPLMRRAGKEALKSGLNIPGVAESYDEGGNLVSARYAKGLGDGQSLLPPLERK